MDITVIRVNNSFLMHEFLNLPGKINTAQNDLNLYDFNPFCNPVLRHMKLALFLARRGKKTVGRICAAVDELNPDQKTGFFGCFESIDDPSVARALVSTAASWLASVGKKQMVGPATFNTNQQVGLLVEGYDTPPSFMMPYNPPYYRNLLEKAGLEKLTDLVSYRWPLTSKPVTNLKAAADRAARIPNLSVRTVNFANISRDAGIIQHIYNRAMSKNWGFIPLTYAEVRNFLLSIKRFADPNLLLIAFVGTRPAGMVLCIPQSTDRKNFRLAILGIVPEYRFRGIHALLIEKLYRKCVAGGYEEVEISQVEKNNTTVLKLISSTTGSQPCRTHRVYSKAVG